MSKPTEKPRKHLAFLVCFGPHHCSYMTGSGFTYKECRSRALAYCISVLSDMGESESRLYKCVSMKRAPEFDGKPFPYALDERRAKEFADTHHNDGRPILALAGRKEG